MDEVTLKPKRPPTHQGDHVACGATHQVAFWWRDFAKDQRK